MPYILDNMAMEDIPEVARIERLCFSMPWPTSAYKRELKSPDTNRYIVSRFLTAEQARVLGLREPAEQTVTALSHPEVRRMNGHEHPGSQQGGARPLWANLLPWLRPGTEPSTNGQKDDPQVVGYAGLWLMVDEAHVTTIGVHPGHRGHGAGELLFLGLADIAAEMKALRITLEVRVSNTGAQALYKKYGLEIAGVRRRYYSDNGEDAYIMWSEPIASPQYQSRLARLRSELTARLRTGFYQELPPAHAVDPGKLQ